MKKLLFATLAMVAIITSCTTSNDGVKTTISGRFVGTKADSVFLERVSDNFTTPQRVGAVALADNGAFSFEFGVEESSPRFYRLTFAEKSRPVTLVVAPGDDITLESAGDIFLNYTVEGSEESALIREFNRAYFAAADRLTGIVENISAGNRSFDDWEMDAYRAAREAIRAQVTFVGTNRDRLAAFYAMRHTVAENYIPQLDGYGINVAHIRTVIDGLKERYPDSPYIAILEADLEQREAVIRLGESVTERSYPDLELQDIYKRSHRLSDLDGKVVLLYFWSANDAVCNNINAELKPLYESYHDRGFEIYHVSADANESVWIEAVREQRLPWVSVLATDIAPLSTYNVAQLPTAFIIDREGNLKVTSLVVADLERTLNELL